MYQYQKLITELKNVEVKKAAIEIRYINFQIYICYNAYRQERIIISPENAPDPRKPFFLQVVKEKCDMCNRKTEDRFRNY